MSKPTEAVKVVVRCRPLNSRETADGRKVIVDMDVRQGQVKVRNPKGDDNEPPKSFTFDQVYDWETAQADIFDITAKPIIDSVLDGYSGTIFAYGQTGTGKSHTMEGRDEPAEQRGIIPNTFNYIFERIPQMSGVRCVVYASYLEIYNEEIRDLVANNPNAKLELKEHPEKGVFVKDLILGVVTDAQQLNNVLKAGKANRMVAATKMNADSSRSHSIFTILVSMEVVGEQGDQAKSSLRLGKLNLVDLAGSERQSKTGAVGDRLKEGIAINQSLSALGQVIKALVDGKGKHVPYRDSKLTRLLQDSLGGNAKTVMVANVGPADWNYEETMSTLRYANSAKNIQNKPTINEDPKDAMIRQFQDQIAALKEELAQKLNRRSGGVAAGPAAAGRKPRSSVAPTRIEKVVEKVVEVVDESAAMAEIERIRQETKADMEARMRESATEEALRKAREEAQQKVQQQLETALADQSRSEEQRLQLKEEARRLLANMQELQNEVAAEAKEREALEAKIAAMESKVLHGGVNLLDKADELKKRSEDAKRALEIQKRQEEEQERRVRELQAVKQNNELEFATLAEQVAYYEAQIKQQYVVSKARQTELQDLREQFAAEKEDLLDDYRQLTRDIKLKNLVIACFIPPEYQDQIMRHCHYDDYDQSWTIDFIECAGNAMRALRDRQSLQAQQEQQSAQRGNLTADAEKLQNMYLSYDGGLPADQQQQQQRTAHTTSSSSRPGSRASRPSAASRRSTGEQRPGTGSPSSPGRNGSSRRLSPGSPGSSMLKGGGSILWGAGSSAGSDGDHESIKAAYPSAKGLVKDTVDPRLRTSRATKER